MEAFSSDTFALMYPNFNGTFRLIGKTAIADSLNVGSPTVNLTPIGFTPTPTGNGSDLVSFVEDPNNKIYYIDDDGNSFLIRDSVYISNDTLFWNDYNIVLPSGVTDHGALTGLSDDDHTIYNLLAGRSGGQTIIGGTGTTDDLILQATSGVGASGSDILLKTGNNGAITGLAVDYLGRVGIGTETPTVMLQVGLSGTPDNENVLKINGRSQFAGDVVYGGASVGYLQSGAVTFFAANFSTVMAIDASTAKVGIGTGSPTEKLDINSDAIRIRTAQTPASAGATGTTGMICWDADYIYICVATDTWKRVAIATW